MSEPPPGTPNVPQTYAQHIRNQTLFGTSQRADYVVYRRPTDDPVFRSHLAIINCFDTSLWSTVQTTGPTGEPWSYMCHPADLFARFDPQLQEMHVQLDDFGVPRAQCVSSELGALVRSNPQHPIHTVVGGIPPALPTHMVTRVRWYKGITSNGDVCYDQSYRAHLAAMQAMTNSTVTTSGPSAPSPSVGHGTSQVTPIKASIGTTHNVPGLPGHMIHSAEQMAQMQAEMINPQPHLIQVPKQDVVSPPFDSVPKMKSMQACTNPDQDAERNTSSFALPHYTAKDVKGGLVSRQLVRSKEIMKFCVRDCKDNDKFCTACFFFNRNPPEIGSSTAEGKAYKCFRGTCRKILPSREEGIDRLNHEIEIRESAIENGYTILRPNILIATYRDSESFEGLCLELEPSKEEKESTAARNNPASYQYSSITKDEYERNRNAPGYGKKAQNMKGFKHKSDPHSPPKAPVVEVEKGDHTWVLKQIAKSVGQEAWYLYDDGSKEGRWSQYTPAEWEQFWKTQGFKGKVTNPNQVKTPKVQGTRQEPIKMARLKPAPKITRNPRDFWDEEKGKWDLRHKPIDQEHDPDKDNMVDFHEKMGVRYFYEGKWYPNPGRNTSDGAVQYYSFTNNSWVNIPDDYPFHFYCGFTDSEVKLVEKESLHHIDKDCHWVPDFIIDKDGDKVHGQSFEGLLKWWNYMTEGIKSGRFTQPDSVDRLKSGNFPRSRWTNKTGHWVSRGRMKTRILCPEHFNDDGTRKEPEEIDEIEQERERVLAKTSKVKAKRSESEANSIGSARTKFSACTDPVPDGDTSPADSSIPKKQEGTSHCTNPKERNPNKRTGSAARSSGRKHKRRPKSKVEEHTSVDNTEHGPHYIWTKDKNSLRLYGIGVVVGGYVVYSMHPTTKSMYLVKSGWTYDPIPSSWISSDKSSTRTRSDIDEFKGKNRVTLEDEDAISSSSYCSSDSDLDGDKTPKGTHKPPVSHNNHDNEKHNEMTKGTSPRVASIDSHTPFIGGTSPGTLHDSHIPPSVNSANGSDAMDVDEGAKVPNPSDLRANDIMEIDIEMDVSSASAPTEVVDPFAIGIVPASMIITNWVEEIGVDMPFISKDRDTFCITSDFLQCTGNIELKAHGFVFVVMGNNKVCTAPNFNLLGTGQFGSFWVPQANDQLLSSLGPHAFFEVDRTNTSGNCMRAYLDSIRYIVVTKQSGTFDEIIATGKNLDEVCESIDLVKKGCLRFMQSRFDKIRQSLGSTSNIMCSPANVSYRFLNGLPRGDAYVSTELAYDVKCLMILSQYSVGSIDMMLEGVYETERKRPENELVNFHHTGNRIELKDYRECHPVDFAIKSLISQGRRMGAVIHLFDFCSYRTDDYVWNLPNRVVFSIIDKIHKHFPKLPQHANLADRLLVLDEPYLTKH